MLNEQDLLGLYKLMESTNALWEIHGLPGFHKVLIRDLWLIYGTEKMQWAITQLGERTWKPRMLKGILDGSVKLDAKPSWVQEHKHQSHTIIKAQPHTEPIGNVGDIDPDILASVDPSIQELVRKMTRK